MKSTVKELLGKEVLDANAKVVDKVADINLDIERATILSFVYKNSCYWTSDVSGPANTSGRNSSNRCVDAASDRAQRA